MSNPINTLPINNLIDGIDISSLLKAREVFERFRKQLDTDQEKAGAIQAFEFCYEQSWKTMRRVLANRGVETRSPRDCFRAAAQNKLIAAPEPWFRFIEQRNLTVHTYRIEVMDGILGVFDQFSTCLTEFIDRLNDSK